MYLNENTCGCLPPFLEIYQQHCRLLESEIQELNLLLRKMRADIFLFDAQAKNSEYIGYLPQRGAEVVAMRKQISDLTLSPTSVNERQTNYNGSQLKCGHALMQIKPLELK